MDFFVEYGFHGLAIRPLHASLLERVEQLVDGIGVALTEEFLPMLLDHLLDRFADLLPVHFDSDSTRLLQKGDVQLGITQPFRLDTGVVGQLLQIGDCFRHLEIALHLVLHHPSKENRTILL